MLLRVAAGAGAERGGRHHGGGPAAAVGALGGHDGLHVQPPLIMSN